MPFHYCSDDAFRNILQSKVLWLTNVFQMEDETEVKWVYNIALKMVEEQYNLLAEMADSLGEGVYPLEEYLNVLGTNLQRWHEFDHFYCICFTSERDGCHHWQEYTEGGSGVAIDFQIQPILSENRSAYLREWTVEYSEAVQQQEVKRIIERFTPPTNFSYDSPQDVQENHPRNNAFKAYDALRRIAPMCKSPSFEWERETRLLLHNFFNSNFHDRKTSAKLFVQGFPGGVESRTCKGREVSYTAIRIPASSVQGVILGGRSSMTEDDVQQILRTNGISLSDSKICRSAVS